MVIVDVSLGEAFDKLTILEIKLEKINNDSKRKLVKEEYDLLYNKLISYLTGTNINYYNLLKNINTEIWILMDLLRDSRDQFNNEQYGNLCAKTVIDNDRRFRIKDKININSVLKEQKGYKITKVLVTFYNKPLIRYLSSCFDQVYLLDEYGDYSHLIAEFNDPSIFIINKVGDCNEDDYNKIYNINDLPNIDISWDLYNF